MFFLSFAAPGVLAVWLGTIDYLPCVMAGDIWSGVFFPLRCFLCLQSVRIRAALMVGDGMGFLMNFTMNSTKLTSIFLFQVQSHILSDVDIQAIKLFNLA